MYTGEYNHTIDTKSRLIIPAKFREALGECFVVTRGVGNCLAIYDMTEWNEYVSKLRSLPGNAEVKKMIRFIVAGALETDTDKQGRVVLQPHLLQWAGLSKDVVLAGMGGHIEVWDKDKWNSLNTFDDIEEISEHLADMGLSF